MFIHIADLKGHVGKSVSIRGWVHRRRSSKNIVFIVLRDVSGIAQCTFPAASEYFSIADSMLVESSCSIKGKVKKDERAPGGYEIEGEKLEVYQKADIFPVQENQSVEFLLDNRHLWLRSQQQNTILKIKSAALAAAREWFSKNKFFEVTPPIITTNACESGSTLFSFKYFDQVAYLSQSAQMYLEAMCFNLERVYSITPSFRAEKSRTLRHLAEYWHIEGEQAWMSHEENMKVQEELVEHMCHAVAKMQELQTLGRDPKDLLHVKAPFRKLDYSKAIEILQGKGSKIKWGDDLGTEDERLLTQDEKAPIFVEKYPKHVKAFYMRENPDDPRTVLCADMLAPEGYGEIIGGSEREIDHAKLLARLKEEKIPLKPYQWYLDLRKYGSVQHSGFGLGTERFIRWACKLEHIRDTIPFPRVMNRAYP